MYVFHGGEKTTKVLSVSSLIVSCLKDNLRGKDFVMKIKSF